MQKEQKPIVIGENAIVDIEPLILVKSRIILGMLLSICTAFIFTLICHWYIDLELNFFYRKSDIFYASHILIIDNHKQKKILKLNKRPYSGRFLQPDALFFTFLHLNYYFNTSTNKFQALTVPIDLENMQPRAEEDIKVLREIFGPCNVEVPNPSVLEFLFNELTSPFYLLQYISITLFMMESVYQLGIMMVSFSIFTSLINYWILRSARLTLKEKAHHEETIFVERSCAGSKQMRPVSSLELVPGDLIHLKQNMFLPCDCVIANGEVLVDEQTLTGESIPVQKEAYSRFLDCMKYTLYDGTKLVLTRSKPGETVKAIVTKTGFQSYKGQIYRKALQPKPFKLVFFSDAVKFLVILSLVVLGLYFGMLYKMISLELGTKLILFRFGDAITWIIPPSLIIFINLCMTATLRRLNTKEILGTEPHKNMESGLVNTICFDKTGTLTTHTIQLKQILPAKSTIEISYFEEAIIADDQLNSPLKEQALIYDLMYTCHQACYIDGELQGDALDVAMVKYSGRCITENKEQSSQIFFEVHSTVADSRLDVLKIFGFESARQMMSVIVKKQDQYLTFSKGSPEKIAELCSRLPNNYQDTVEKYARKGYRILSMAYKKIETPDLIREKCENELTFLGLLVLENKLKHDTAEVIQKLQNAKLDCKIISGDNALTSINCGLESSILRSTNIYLLDIEKEKETVSYRQLSFDRDYSFDSQRPDDLQMSILQTSQLDLKLYQPSDQQESINYPTIVHDDYELAVTGRALEKLGEDTAQMNKVVTRAKIFARMSPIQKQQIVGILQNNKQKVMMVGDGANDCAALMQANIGVSFTRADASTTATFSSYNESIQCVEEVILEGKATMANVLEAFKYLMIINVTKFVSVQLIMYEKQNFNGEQLLYINYFSNIPLVGLISLTGPARPLTRQILDVSMIQMKNIVPLFITLLIASLGLFFSYLHLIKSPFFKQDLQLSESQYDFVGDANTVLFLSLNLQFLLNYVANYTSNPFKPRFWQAYHISIPTFFLFLLVTSLYFFRRNIFTRYLGQSQEFADTTFYFEQYCINLAFGLLSIIFGTILWHLSYKRRKNKKIY